MKNDFNKFKNVLERSQLKLIGGGGSDSCYGVRCQSTCTSDSQCKHAGCPNSYCATDLCNVSGDINIRRRFCQW